MLLSVVCLATVYVQTTAVVMVT